jgi:hypothetical protein
MSLDSKSRDKIYLKSIQKDYKVIFVGRFSGTFKYHPVRAGSVFYMESI